MTRDELDEDAIVFDNPNYDSALVGMTHDGRAVYDYDKMVACLIHDDGCTEEDAVDFIDFNTLGVLNPADTRLPIVVHFL